MLHEIVPAGDSHESSQNEQPHDRSHPDHAGDPGRRRPGDRAIPSVDDCLVAIAALPGLVAMRVLTPAQANSIRAHYETILRHHDRTRQGQSAQIADEDVLKVWRERPELIELLNPLLTPDQLSMIMREVKTDGDR